MKQKAQSGFTLIELSIVLVIIGLIVGGVLVGRDLIKAAELRATISQIERYNTAVNTFQIKYGGIPGDLSSGLAAGFGMVARPGLSGQGDGDGQIENCFGNTGVSTTAGCEVLVFWVDLSYANLIEGNFSTAVDSGVAAGISIAGPSLPLYFPTAKMGRGNYITVYADSGMNYYELAALTSTGFAGFYIDGNAITPAEAGSMDTKMDDGSPLTGRVIATEANPGFPFNYLDHIATPSATTCVLTGGTQYNTTATYGDSFLCHLRIQFQ